MGTRLFESPVASPEADDDTARPARPSRALPLFVATGLFGLLLLLSGLAVDAFLHAHDADLAAEEGLFTIRNPGHVLLGLGILGTTVGLLGAAAILTRTMGRTPAVRFARVALTVGVLGVAGVFTYLALGPGLSHNHGADVGQGLELSDGSRISSSIAADVDRSRLPRDQAAALAALAWSRPSSLEGVTEHDHGDETAVDVDDLSPADRALLDLQWAQATAAVPDYMTVEQAEAAGYIQAGPFVNGVGSHWVKWSLVDRPFDPAQPSMLLFEEVKYGEGPSLVGFSYWVTSEDEPEGFAGDADVWHQHYGLCFQDGWLALEDIPDRSQCDGDWVNGSDLWMLHAWVVPGMDNRLGQFAAVNPRLCERSCG